MHGRGVEGVRGVNDEARAERTGLARLVRPHERHPALATLGCAPSQTNAIIHRTRRRNSSSRSEERGTFELAGHGIHTVAPDEARCRGEMRRRRDVDRIEDNVGRARKRFSQHVFILHVKADQQRDPPEPRLPHPHLLAGRPFVGIRRPPLPVESQHRTRGLEQSCCLVASPLCTDLREGPRNCDAFAQHRTRVRVFESKQTARIVPIYTECFLATADTALRYALDSRSAYPDKS